MKKATKIFLPFLAAALTAATLSCSDEGTKKEDAKPAGDSTALAATPAVTEAFKPFDILVITQTVKDYATWRPFFDKDSVNRTARGLETAEVGRSADNPNSIVTFFIAENVAKAKVFAASPVLKETMTKAGVTGMPAVEYFHVLRFNPEAKEKSWVVIKHKVKDYDAWLKAYDSEGTAKRNTEGINDVLIARGIDDPNMVEIIFDITDMAKAKAAIGSDEKKKLMEGAGVEGKPEINFYTTAE